MTEHCHAGGESGGQAAGEREEDDGRDRTYLRENAAPTARPSAKLWTASPTMTIILWKGED